LGGVFCDGKLGGGPITIDYPKMWGGQKGKWGGTYDAGRGEHKRGKRILAGAKMDWLYTM